MTSGNNSSSADNEINGYRVGILFISEIMTQGPRTSAEFVSRAKNRKGKSIFP
jgi:hypothetical protein